MLISSIVAILTFDLYLHANLAFFTLRILEGHIKKTCYKG